MSLVSRLLLAQAAVTGAIGLAYLRPNVTWLLVILMVTVALCWLAGLVRSGGRAAWLAAVGRAFGPEPRGGLATPREVRVGEQSLAENTGGALGGGAG